MRSAARHYYYLAKRSGRPMIFKSDNRFVERVKRRASKGPLYIFAHPLYVSV